MSQNNRLEFILSAKADSLLRSLKDSSAAAKRTGQEVQDAFADAGQGVKQLEDAVEGADFRALVTHTKEVAKEIEQAFERSGSSLDEALIPSGDGLAGIFKPAEESLSDIVDRAATVKQALVDAFINGDTQSRATTDAVRRLDAALKNIGDDGAKSFQQVKQALDRVEASRLTDELAKAEKATQDFEASAKAGFQSVENAIDSLDEQVGKLGEGVDNLQFDNALGRAQELGQRAKASVDQAAAAFLDAGEEGRAFERIIRGAFADTKSQEVFIKKAQEIKDAYKDAVQLEEIGKAAQKLDLLGAGTPANLERVAKVAKDVGREMDDVGEILGEALSPLEAGNFDVGVFEEMRVSLGISAKALKQYGAEVDITGKILGETAQQQQKAQDALKKYIDESDRYANIATRIQDNYSKAQGEVDKFNRSVGDQVNEFKNVAAGAVLPLLELLNEMPDSLKTVVAGFALFGPPVAGLVTTMGQLYGATRLVKLGLASVAGSAVEAGSAATKLAPVASIADKVKVSVGGLATAAKGLALTSVGVAGAVAGIGLALVPVALAIREYHKGLIDVEKAEQALIATQATASVKYKEHIADINKTVTALKGEADALEDNIAKRNKLTADIALKSGEADAQRRQGNTAVADQLDRDAQALREYRATVDAESSKIAKAETDRFEKSRQAYLKYEKDVQQGAFDSKKQQLQALESAMAGLDGGALEQAAAARKKLNAEILADELATLKTIAAQRNLSTKEVGGRLQQLLSQYQSNGEARKDIERDIAEFTKGLDDARLQRVRKLTEDELNLKRSALQLDRDRLDLDSSKVESLQEQLDKGKDVTGELTRELAGRAENQKRLIEAEAILDRIALKQQTNADAAADPTNAERIRKNAAERERQLNQKVAQDKAKVNQQLSKDQESVSKKRVENEKAAASKKVELEAKQADLAIRAAEQQRQAQSEAFEERRRHYEAEMAAGRNRSYELRLLDEEQAKAMEANIQEQAKLAVDGIKKRAEAAKAGKSAEEQALVEQEAQLDISQTLVAARKESNSLANNSLVLLREKTIEETKQLELLQKQNAERKKSQGFKSTFSGEAYGVDQINSNTSQMGVSRRDLDGGEARTEDGRTEREVAADLGRQRARLADLEDAQARRQSSHTSPGGSTPGTADIGPTPTPFNPNTGSAPSTGPIVNGMTLAQGAELIGAVKALQQTLGQAAAALNRREPSTLGQGWGRGGQRTEGVY